MRRRIGLTGLIAAAGLLVGSDLLACGDKFLVAGRGTRYQRPKNFRAASVLIYANPSSDLQASLRKVPLESVLKREGHRATKVEARDQLSATLASGRYDVVLAAGGDAAAVGELVGRAADAPVVLGICPKSAEHSDCALKAPKEHSLLEAIDKAVVRLDNARKAQARL